MAGIRLEFSQFGDFDSFDILRSSSPMDIAALPSPIVTGLATMYYVDTAVVEGAAYYYRARVWRGAESVISSETKVYAVTTYEHDFASMEGLEVFGSDTTGVYIASGGGLIIGATSYQSLVVKLQQAPELKNFEAVFDLTYLSASGNTTVLLAFRSDVWSSNAGKLAYMFGANHNRPYAIKGTNSSGSSSETDLNPYMWSSNIVVGVKAKIKIVVQDAQMQVFINDVLKGAVTDSTHTDAGGLGFRMWTDGSNSAKVENLVISPL